MSAMKKDPTPLMEEDEEISLEPKTSEPLGLPLPRDEHACSVSLPTWGSVVGYEEGDESITSAMRCGYPRFVYHPLILQLMTHVVNTHSTSGKEDCLVVPGYAAAVRCQAFLQQALEGPNQKDNALLCQDNDDDDVKEDTSRMSRIRIVPVGAENVHAVLFPAETPAAMQAKAYWQHTGELVSSRRAEQALTKLGVTNIERAVTCGPKAPYTWHSSCGKMVNGTIKAPSTSTTKQEDVFMQLRQNIAEWTQVPSPESVFLTPSGMASIYTTLRSARRYHMQNSAEPNMGGRAVVYGFPYLDTLKLCSRKEVCPGGVHFFGYGNDKDLALLTQVLEQQEQSGQTENKISAVFTEVPSNPLLQCPDLYALRALADKYDFALIVDDTIGNFLNIDMIHTGIADAICTSLTKIVSGRGDAMAGSVVVNPNTEKGRWMQQDLQREYTLSNNNSNDTALGLFEADASAILANSHDFVQRNQKINETTEVLADWLVDHPDVETVYYPKYAPLYPSLISPSGGGFGGLMSILLESHVCQRTFYDQFNVAKGPSLGTNFTLVCPYTLLAHYHELDFAMSYNVSPNILRISVGLEDVDLMKDKFEDAFSKSRLYPKLKTPPPPAAAAGSMEQVRSYSTMTEIDVARTFTGASAAARMPFRAAITNTAVGRLGGRSTMMSMMSLLKRVPR